MCSRACYRAATIGPPGRCGPWPRLGAVWLLMTAMLTLSPRRAMMVGLVLGLGVLGLSAGLLAGLRIWLMPAPALLGLLVAYPLWGWRRLAAASAFLAAEIDRLAADPAMADLPKAPAASGDLVGRQAWACSTGPSFG